MALILDESSSMRYLAQAVRDSFNQYVRGLVEQEGETLVSLTIFADKPKFVYDCKGIETVGEMTEETYLPYGNTALYDSIAATAKRLDAQLREQGKQDTRILVVTITDGADTASQQYTPERLASLVEEYEARGNWTFTWIGLGQTRAQHAILRGVGYSQDNGYLAAATFAGVSHTMSSLAASTNSLRSSGKMQSARLLGDAIDLGDGSSVDPNAGLSGVLPGVSSFTHSTAGAGESSLLSQLRGL